MGNMAEDLASYGEAITYDDIPPEAVHKAKGLLMDTLACAIGAYSSEPAKIARKLASQVKSRKLKSTILGSGKKSSPEMATFANGVMMRFLDFNDGYTGKGVCHPSDTFAPVLTCAAAPDSPVAGSPYTIQIAAGTLAAALAKRTPRCISRSMFGVFACGWPPMPSTESFRSSQIIVMIFKLPNFFC